MALPRRVEYTPDACLLSPLKIFDGGQGGTSVTHCPIRETEVLLGNRIRKGIVRIMP